MHDPRPDLIKDSGLWTKFLQLAQEKDPFLAGVLHGFRCMGTRLQLRKKGYTLRADTDPTGSYAWISLKEYDEEKEKWLGPHREKLVELLRQI